MIDFPRAILTLSRSDFEKVSLSLGDKVIELCSPDLVVVVPRAGDYIWDVLKNHPGFEFVNVVKIKAQRAFTKHKGNKILRRIVKNLPRVANNGLRHLESVSREFFLRFNRFKNSKKIVIDCVDLEAISRAKCIVILDDAIDSGESILCIRNFIKKNNQHGDVYVAVITTTFSAPIIYPDISLFNRQIIRFPWAEDYDE